MSKPILWIVIPCYNEEKVLPITAPMFLQKLQSLAEKGLVSDIRDLGQSGQYPFSIGITKSTFDVVFFI